MVSMHGALVVAALGQVKVEKVPTKRPRSGEILVAPLRVGICGSDLDMMRGTRPAGTAILGHEGVAEVVAVGPGVTQFSVGQHVTFLPNNPNDPENVLGGSTEGLYQQSLLIPQPALERGMIVPCETGLSLACAPLSEPLATVMYGQRLMERVGKPASMVIVGAGPIGLLNALYAKEQGCSQIFVVNISQGRLDWAVKRGITDGPHALLNSPQLVDILLERTAGRGVDAAYLCTPRSATRSVLAQALRFVREGGGIDLTAGTASRDEFPELPGVDLDGIRRANTCGLGNVVNQCMTREGKRIWLTGQSGASASYLKEAMRLLVKEPAHYARVISHVVSYRAAPLIFEHLLAAEPRNVEGEPCVKVIIDFTEETQEIDVFEPLHLLSGEPNA